MCVTVEGHVNLFCFGVTATPSATPSAAASTPSAASTTAVVASSVSGWVDLPLQLTGRQALTMHHSSLKQRPQNTTRAVFFIQQVTNEKLGNAEKRDYLAKIYKYPTAAHSFNVLCCEVL